MDESIRKRSNVDSIEEFSCTKRPRGEYTDPRGVVPVALYDENKSHMSNYYEGRVQELQHCIRKEQDEKVLLTKQNLESLARIHTQLAEKDAQLAQLQEQTRLLKRAVQVQDTRLKEAFSEIQKREDLLISASNQIAKLNEENSALREALAQAVSHIRNSSENVYAQNDNYFPKPPPDIY